MASMKGRRVYRQCGVEFRGGILRLWRALSWKRFLVQEGLKESSKRILNVLQIHRCCGSFERLLKNAEYFAGIKYHAGQNMVKNILTLL